MKHNAGILPKLQTQLELVLNAHGRFHEVIYDTQEFMMTVWMR